MKTALLAALLVLPASSFAAEAAAPAPSGPALALLLESFGASTVETLAQRGVVVLQGKPGSRRLAAVHWKALDALNHAASSCLALTSAADALGHEAAPVASDAGFSACRALPVDGPMTPSLQALAAALEAGHQERWALQLASAPLAGVAGKPNIYDTAWGKDLVARRHADALENPASLVKPVFDELLSGPRPDKDAAALFAAEAAARGAANPEVLIAYDSAHGALSEELRERLRRTLSNERRRWAADKARSAATALLGSSAVKRELEDLRGIAKALQARPNLSTALEAAASRAPEAGVVRLKSAGLHLQDPTRLGQHELGDGASVSGAYWVDGLLEGSSVEVEETLAVETERGFPSVETRTYKRSNGGPYPFSRELKIEETRPFAVRSFVSVAGGAMLAERVEVPLAPDFELALSKESEAAGLRGACRLKDAETAYAALETLVAEPAKIKPQYKALGERAKKARETLKADSENALKLEEALAAARADSAPQLCRYETGRVEDALKLAKKLPAGCDASLPELHALRATIQRRSTDQNWFLRASAEARSRRKSCDLEAARGRWSEALASLDADPGARCGKASEEEAKAKTELAETARLIAWRESLLKDLAKAETETTPERRLELSRPVLSRLGALNETCFAPESKRASALAAAASKSLAAPAEADLVRRLPRETALASAVSDVRAERARRLEAATAAEKAAVEPSAAPAADKPAAAPKPAGKPAAHRPARKKKKEASAQ